MMISRMLYLSLNIYLLLVTYECCKQLISYILTHNNLLNTSNNKLLNKLYKLKRIFFYISLSDYIVLTLGYYVNNRINIY